MVVVDDVFKKLCFGVKTSNKGKNVYGARNAEENRSLRLRILPEDVKKTLRESKKAELLDDARKDREEEEIQEDGLTILSGLNLSVDKKKKKRKLSGKGPEESSSARSEMIARLRRMNRIYSWGENIPEPILEWEDVEGTNEILMRNLKESNILDPTPIQMQTIPTMLQRRNVLASAPTGSGKTLAFAFPLLIDVMKTRRIRMLKKLKNDKRKKGANVEDGETHGEEGNELLALVIEPTRELAKQTYRHILKFSSGLPVRCGLLEEEPLKHSYDILVCTPNRLLHRIEKEEESESDGESSSVEKAALNLCGLRWLVVDESDRLFEAVEGDERCFRNQLAAIYKACEQSPFIRKAFFSATFSYEVEEWCKENLKKVAMICIGERNSSNSSVEQELIFTGSEHGKVLALRDLLSTQFTPPALIFVQSKERGRQLMAAIESMAKPVPAAIISSERTVKQREAALESFRSGRVWVLVCTELLGRGLDLPAVNLVINFDLPSSIVSYIHRVGRTGRAGRSGRAITYFTEADIAIVRPIAIVISQAGFPVPPYTLQLKAPSREKKKDTLKHAPKRKDITHLKKKKKKAIPDGKEDSTVKEKSKDEANMGEKQRVSEKSVPRQPPKKKIKKASA